MTGQSPNANTHTVPPSGTSGNSPGRMAFSRVCIARASMPHPDCTATYWRPFRLNDDGWPMTPELVGYSHRTCPVRASNARNMRSDVPPPKTSPPPVASNGPQFADLANGWVHTRAPVSTFHACTSPMWSAPGTIDITLRAPVKADPAEYFTGIPSMDAHRFSFAGT